MYALQQLRNVPNAATARPRRGLRVPCPFRVGYANGPDVKRLERIESRASQVPAAAVIPARQKNIKFVAVEKFVVGPGPAMLCSRAARPWVRRAGLWVGGAARPRAAHVTVKKSKRSKRALAGTTRTG